MSRLLPPLLGVSIGLVLGCGGASSGLVANPQKEALADLGQLLKQLAAENKRPPGKPAELDAVEPMVPTAGPAIRSGQVVYFWGAAYTAGGTRVVAHEKKAPEAGGFALLEDGTVKEMSAAEFAAAPKAKKS
jgi:hypothetical protein